MAPFRGSSVREQGVSAFYDVASEVSTITYSVFFCPHRSAMIRCERELYKGIIPEGKALTAILETSYHTLYPKTLS